MIKSQRGKCGNISHYLFNSDDTFVWVCMRSADTRGRLKPTTTIIERALYVAFLLLLLASVQRKHPHSIIDELGEMHDQKA